VFSELEGSIAWGSMQRDVIVDSCPKRVTLLTVHVLILN
jgi:hypothetical protein